jgi:hypothetical protein
MTEFSESGVGIGIPYPPERRADGTNHGYIDLKRSPQEIHRIPELNGYPELFRLIQEVNTATSVFRTAGCAVRVKNESGQWQYRCFVHLLFEILHWNTSRDCYRTLFARFKEWEKHQAAICHSRVQFSLGPASFWDHGFDGWSLRLYVDGHGSPETDAREKWGARLLALSSFLSEFSAVHQPQLEGCLKRVS